MDSRLVATVLAGVLASPVAAQTVVDGDTIELDGTRWRLWGIDAPEMDQTCGTWIAGVASTYALADLMRGKTIACELRGRDRYGRSIGLCRADGRELGTAMVSAGIAWASTRYSSDYIHLERAAIGAHLGVHAHDCMKAWDWASKAALRAHEFRPRRPTQ